MAPVRKRPRIVVVGSAIMDLTTFTDRFPKPGETMFGNEFDLGFGGKGANQAVAARYCGSEVDMVARVGDDIFGPATIRNFERQDIGCRHVRKVKGAASGVAPIFVDSSGQNRIVVIKGANDALTPDAADLALPRLRRADCIVLQFEVPLNTVYHVVALARDHGVRCILNPAPACKANIRRIRDVDYFVPNETEAEALTGQRVRTIRDATSAARTLLDMGFRRVLLTLGDKGVLAADSDGTRHFPAFDVRAKDTSGAGDAFIGSFATLLAEGRSEDEAIQRASLYAAISTRNVGTQKSFVRRREFDAEWRKRAGSRRLST